MAEKVVETMHVQSDQPSSTVMPQQLESNVQQPQSSTESDEVIGGARELISKSSSNIPVLVPLQVPKAFKYPERYRSPTDAMVSPVTRGLMGRKRRGGGGREGAPLPLPPINANLSQKLQAAE